MSREMRPCHVVEIVTPKKFVLNGLWFGPTKPKRAVVFIHGLSGSVFSMRRVVDALVDQTTAVITFNNRGFGKINTVKRKVGKYTKSIIAGAAHELFTDSADDIQGAINFVRKSRVKNIYIAGQSTGCQKACYWAYRAKGGKGVKGIILLGPVSDYAAARKLDTKGRLAKAIRLARTLIRRGKKHELLPSSLLTSWSMDDAQRFLSLYTPDSIEEIFSYAQPNKIPRVLRSIKVPVLVLWSERDEYSDRSAKKVAEWFEKHLQTPHRIVLVPKVSHQLRGAEKSVAHTIHKWILSNKSV